MAEEESFVILDTSPSMESFNNKSDETEDIPKTITINFNKTPSSKENNLNNKNDLISSVLSTNSDGAFSLLTQSTIKTNTVTDENKRIITDKDNENKSMNSVKSEFESAIVAQPMIEIPETKSSLNETSSSNENISRSNVSLLSKNNKNSSISQTINSENKQSGNNSLAASFILGEVSMNEIRENVFSHFPSLYSSETKTSDILKLQNLMSEYKELKENLRTTNTEMRQYIESIQKWKNEMKAYKDNQTKEMEECKRLIEELREENLKLKTELEDKIEIVRLNDVSLRDDNDELRKILSEKVSLVANLSAQICKLEQQHNSFEFVKQDNEDDKNSIECEFIPLLEHNKIIKDIERKLTECVAENLDLKNKQQLYIDEITALKVNYVAAEELLNKQQVDINVLKKKDYEKTEFIEKYEKDKNELKQEIQLLRMQLDVYRKDFEMERDSRQKLAGEKDQLIMDLKMLQKRNQQLIEETQVRFNKEMYKNSPSTSCGTSTSSLRRKTSINRETEKVNNAEVDYTCPLCLKKFKDVDILMEHTQDCIDKM